MDPTDSIRRLGFRRWYERELIKGHAALVTGFLCVITIAALMEQINPKNYGPGTLTAIGIVAGAMILCWYSVRSYFTILKRAERYGQDSNCPQCQAYGRFKVLATGVDSDPGPAALSVAPLESAWMRVECRQCSKVWRIPD